MAKQRGLLKVEGTLGDLTFYKSKDGYLLREKTSLSASRLANDPAFERTRENNLEFSRAGKGGKLLRHAFRTQLQQASDSRMVSRLFTTFFKVIRADATSVRGQRNVVDGEAELLNGFEFNQAAVLGTTLYAPYTATINRVSGECLIVLPPFLPSSMLAAPAGATHFRLFSAAASIDFEAQTFENQAVDGGPLPLYGAATQAITLSHTLTANSTRPLFLVLGIAFLQEVNAVLYPLQNGAFNALSMVQVNGV
jgi:hypothetical protein